MENLHLMKALVGESLNENDLKYVDCYAHKNGGLFIPSTGKCGYARRDNHTHPSYMIVVMFSTSGLDIKPEFEIKRNHYLATVTSPNVPHCDLADEFVHYYCVLIDKDYFESQYKMYDDNIPVFNEKQFLLCSDILKTLNTFAFECSKGMQNSDITLSAQMTIITHWIIRSILGENMDMRSISSSYSVARAQHFIEQHFSGEITVEQLADLTHTSPSNFNKIFKKDVGLSPIEYLIEVRITKSKALLKRKDISITEIAQRCGFGSSAHFASCFKRLTNKTPSEYRSTYNP